MENGLASAMEEVIVRIGGLYPGCRAAFGIVSVLLSLFAIHQNAYLLIGMFFTRKFPKARSFHKYAVVIAARNEEAVIANLLESIRRQDYPAEYVSVFVVADNCTDATARIVRQCGYSCYERFDDEHRTKGFALQYLFEQIERQYGRTSFEGYFVFDADNLLNRDYLSKMNDAFDAGCKIVTSYRNTKNFDENWIASTYALHWLRSIRLWHRARSVLHLASNIQGTGFLFASEIVKDGWKYTSLTEDRAMTADCVVMGYEISYQDAAVFYDEQPVGLKIAFRQRIRWAKGHILAFFESGWGLFKNIFAPSRAARLEQQSFLARILDSLRHRWMAFDTLGQLIPIHIYNAFRWILVSLVLYPCSCAAGGGELALLQGGTLLSKAAVRLFGSGLVSIPSGTAGVLSAMAAVIWLRVYYRIGRYLAGIPLGVYLFFMERRRIVPIPLSHKILYCLTWPVFNVMGRYAQYAALFMKVTWKPIPHTSAIRIDQIQPERREVPAP